MKNIISGKNIDKVTEQIVEDYLWSFWIRFFEINKMRIVHGIRFGD